MAYENLYNNYGSINSMFGQDTEDTQANTTPTSESVTPVTQTIKIDPVTGEQKMTISGRPEDLTAANPYTPTVTMPTGGIRAEQPQAPGLQMPQAQMQPRTPPGSRIVPLEQAQAQEAAKPVVSPTDANAEDIYQQLKQNFQQPQAPVAPIAQMAGGPATSDVNPPAVTTPAAPVAPPPTATTTPTPAPAPAPVAPTAAPAVNGPALTRQAESGGDYNVGYNRAGTSDAYGAYQILGSTYKEIQRLDPYFAGKDQRSLTPAEQDRANNVVRRINAQGLTSEGVEPTESNLQLAHFLGAKGASDYLKNGTISPEAAAANGGFAKADQIARDRIRMAGGNPDIIPRNEQLNAQDLTEFANKKDLGSLMDIYKKNPTSAEGRAALASITTIQNQELQLEKAKKDIQSAMTSQRGNLEIGKLLSAQKEEGSWGKYLLAGLLGMGDIAKAEGIKLGLNNTWQNVQLADGTSGMVQIRGDGLPIQGITERGAMTPRELTEAAAGAGGKTKPDVSTQDVQKGDIKGRVVTTYDRNNRPTTFVESGGKRYAYDSSWIPVSIGTATAKAEQGAAIKLRYAGPMAYTSAGAEYIGRFNAQNGTRLGYTSEAPGAPLVDLNTGRPVSIDSNGVISVTQNAAPAVQTRPPAGGTTGGTTTGGTTPAPVAKTTEEIPSTITPQTTAPEVPFRSINPGESPAIYEKEKEDFYKNRAETQKVQTNRTEAFNNIIDKEYRETAQKGDIVSRNRKDQFAILNRLDENGKPIGEQLAALYNSANENPNDQKLSIIRDIFGGTFKDKTEVSDRLALLNVSPKVRAALSEFNALNGAIAAQTLKETAGPGSVSDAEQEANRARNVDLTKVPMIGAYQMMAQSQFSGDLQRYKADLAVSDNNKASNATQFDRDFRQISAKLTTAYRQISEDRLKYIQENGNTPNAIREGYRRYPVPEYDPVSGNWKYLKPLDKIFGGK